MEETKLYYVGLHYQGSDKPYYFSTTIATLALGDMVVVDTPNGEEAAFVCILPRSVATYSSNLALKPILRVASKSDKNNFEYNKQQALRALDITREGIKQLNLPMDLIGAVYNLEGSKVTITYTTPEKRVDFRELLHIITRQIDGRVELRQIAARDKAKMIGGLGSCGLPLCCSTFLSAFEGISISKVKNQMLSINIPKLSGQCGRLMCCLAYEDDTYTIEKKDFPRIGTAVKLDGIEYKVDSFNIISRTVRLATAAKDDYKTYPLDDVKAMINGTYKKVESTKKENEFSLPDFNIVASGVKDASYGGMHPSANKGNFRDIAKRDGQSNNRRDNRDNRRGKGQSRPQNGSNQQASQQPNQQQGGNRNRHRHHHGHHQRSPKPNGSNE